VSAPNGTQFLNAQGRVQALPWSSRDAWVCKAGLWQVGRSAPCAVLKLLKTHWSPDSSHSVGNTCGIFFSVWQEAASEHRLIYNIHALKLRALPGYKLESRKFAAAFRERFAARQRDWPGVRTDFGPQTLMQGDVAVSPQQLEVTIMDLTERFLPLAPILDNLLAACATHD